MNGDEIGNMVRQIATAVLSSGAVTAYVSHDQAVALGAGLAALVSVAWSIAAHWGMKKVPADAVVVSAPKDGGK
jgi:hypothetical protein